MLLILIWKNSKIKYLSKYKKVIMQFVLLAITLNFLFEVVCSDIEYDQTFSRHYPPPFLTNALTLPSTCRVVLLNVINQAALLRTRTSSSWEGYVLSVCYLFII